MRLPGPASLIYLAFMLGFLPWAAFRNRSVIRSVGSPSEADGKPAVTRTTLYVSTLISLTLIFVLSAFTGGTFGYRIFAVTRLGAAEAGMGAVALVTLLGLMLVSHYGRPPAERRTMDVYRMLPRTPPEWGLYAAMCLAAGLAEEAAYRGVVTAMLWYSLGSSPAAVLVSATMFAVSHAVQGWKSGIIIFLIALVMHALVWYTGTLVVAMITHAVYDLIAGAVGVWRIRTGQVDL